MKRTLVQEPHWEPQASLMPTLSQLTISGDKTMIAKSEHLQQLPQGKAICGENAMRHKRSASASSTSFADSRSSRMRNVPAKVRALHLKRRESKACADILNSSQKARYQVPEAYPHGSQLVKTRSHISEDRIRESRANPRGFDCRALNKVPKAHRKRQLKELATEMLPRDEAPLLTRKMSQDRQETRHTTSHFRYQTYDGLPFQIFQRRKQARRICLPKSSLIIMLLPFLVFSSLILPITEASVACELTEECESLLRPGSECVDNQCTNPFQNGCIRSYRPDDYPEFRTCNSEDKLLPEWEQQQDTTSNSTLPPQVCTPSPLGYSEIRILSQNWESAMFTAWVLQIVLSELFQVPATIESSGPGRQLNFYDPAMSFSYGALGYDMDALKRANQHGGGTCPFDWRLTEDNYQSCAHVIPEVWSGQSSTVAEMSANGILEPPEGTGVVGKLGWFIPKYVARLDPSLTHWLGLTGNSNRRRLAETFKVPTTFGVYCSEIVPHNCTEPTIFASRPPADEAEAGKYFVSGGVFNGFFRFAEDNDCDLNPDTCVGHITEVPCEWTTYVVPQSHHLDVAVKSQGPQEPNSAYSYGQLLDIWAAANATKSPVLFYWWYPDPTYQFYLGSDAEMQGVQLPPPRQECVTNRVTPAQRCSDNEEERQGTELGACDAEPHSLLKLVIANLFHYLNGKRPPDASENHNQSTANEDSKSRRNNPAFRSPAYDAIQALSITELQLGDMFDAWENRGLDKWNYDPREAVCEWVVDNLDTLETWIPRTYPRVVQQEAYNHDKVVLYGFAVGIGVLVSLLVLGTAVTVYIWRSRPLLVFAQVNFLYFLLFGLELVAIGSVLVAVEPSDATCVLQNWFIMLGYTLEVAPLVVKIGAIHRMMRAAKKMKRITLNQKSLHMTVLFCALLATIVLTVWTAVDPSQRNSEVQLHPNRQTDDGDTIVTITQFCASEDNDEVWRYLSLCWQVVLLLWATVLAFQTRNIRQDLNESHTLGVMIYSHFVFVVLRVITFLLGSAGEDENGNAALERTLLEAIRSLLLSVDVLVATSVYFGPKIYSLAKYDDEYFKAMMAIQRRQSVHRQSVQRSSVRGGSVGSGLGLYAGSMMQSSFSQIGGVGGVSGYAASGSMYGSGDGASGSVYGSGDGSGVDSSLPSDRPRKRRSSSRISFVVGDEPGTPAADVEEEIKWVPDPEAKESSARKLGHEDLSLVQNDCRRSQASESAGSRRSQASESVGSRTPSTAEIIATLPVESYNSRSKSVNSSSVSSVEDKAPQEAAPHQGALSALANLREEVLARNLEAEARARAEKRDSTSSLTKAMYLDYIASSAGGSVRDHNGVRIRNKRRRRRTNSSQEGSGSVSSRQRVVSSLASESENETLNSRMISSMGPEASESEQEEPLEMINIPSSSIAEEEPEEEEQQQQHNPPTPMEKLFEDEPPINSPSIEKQFEKLCSDDKSLGDGHYFF